MINVILVIFFERSVSHLKLALFHSFNGMLQFFKKMYSLRKKWLKILNLINKVDEAGRENKYKILFLNDFLFYFHLLLQTEERSVRLSFIVLVNYLIPFFRV